MFKNAVSKGKLGALYLVFALCILISPADCKEPDTAPTGIKYINPDIPRVNLPAYAGQRYKAVVPDTFDIQEMASLAVHGLTAITNPRSDYEIYWVAAILNQNPLSARHTWSDSTGSKFVEALPLVRLASGSRENMHVEQRWAEVLLHMQSPDDGIFYFPKNGIPWWSLGCYGPKPPGEHFTIIYPNGRYIGTATNYYKLTGDELWKKVGQRAVDGLLKLAKHSNDPPGEDKAWFQWLQYDPGGKFNPGAGHVHNLASWFSWLILGSAEYYEATGYEPAKTFSGQLSRWIINDSGHFAADGTFLSEHPTTTRIHFHGHTMSLVSMIDYAEITGDTAVRDFANNSFLFARDHSRNNTLVGYFPEDLNAGGGTGAETCEVADMIALALKLSQAGAGDYWDDADRWIRNQFVESQLKDGDWIDAAVAGLGMTSAAFNETNDNVSERLVGNFAGNARANEFGGLTMGCCTGNASRTVYWIWENILS